MLLALVEAVDARLARLEALLAIALTGALAVIMMAQVVLRYCFSAPLFWAEEISVQLLVFITLVGMSLLVRARQLVAIDVLAGLLPGLPRRIVQALLAALMLALLAYLAWLGWQWVSRADVRLELGATTRVPRWYSYSAFPVAFALMAWHQMAVLLGPLRPGARTVEGAVRR